MFSPMRNAIRNTVADGQPRRRDHGAQRPARDPAAAGQQQQPDHQVDERRVDERDREPDLRVVEEGQRDREAGQDQQVQVPQRRPSPPRDERGDEQDAERDPDVPGVDAAAERARIAAGHRPRHLEARPGLGHRAGVVVDVDLEQLALGLGVREPADLPGRGALGVLVGDGLGVPAQLGLDSGIGGGAAQHLVGGEPVAAGRRVGVGHQHRRPGGGDRGGDRLGHRLGDVDARRARGRRAAGQGVDGGAAGGGGHRGRGSGQRGQRQDRQQGRDDDQPTQMVDARTPRAGGLVVGHGGRAGPAPVYQRSTP